MEEMDPQLLQFIKDHVITFTRWELIRFLFENPDTRDTAKNLARYIGRSPDVIEQEASDLAEAGILQATGTGKRRAYGLAESLEARPLIARLVNAAQERTFRMKLAYHILRAGDGHE
jgi:hypothetical protein